MLDKILGHRAVPEPKQTDVNIAAPSPAKHQKRPPSPLVRFLFGDGTVSEEMRLRRNERARLRTERALRLWHHSPPRRLLAFFRDVLYMTPFAFFSLLLTPMALTSVFRCLLLPLLTDDFPFLIADGVTGILLALISLLLATYRLPFFRAVTEDRLLARLFFGALALPRPYPTRRRGLPFWPFLLFGFGLAVLSVFVSPLRIAVAGLVLLLLILTLSSPDFFIILFGILFPLAALHPRADVLLLTALAVGTASYLTKLLLGKRHLTFEPIDLALILVALVLLTAGLVSGAGFTAALTDAALLLLGFFLTANLLSTRRILFLFTRGILFMAALLSVLGISSGVMALLDPALLQGDLAHGLLSATDAMPGGGDMLAAYLLVLLPMLFCVMTENDRVGWHYLPFLLLMLGAFALTLSPIAYLVLLLSLILLAVLASRKSAVWPILLLALLPNVLVLVTEDFGGRLASALAFLEMEERVLVLLADLRAGLALMREYPLGVGPALSGGDMLSLLSAYGGVTGDGGSLYLSLGAVYGVPILVALAFLFAVLLRDATRACAVSVENHFRTPAMGAACGLFSLLFLAPYANVLANDTMLLLTALVLGVMTAARRAGLTEEEILSRNMHNDVQESASTAIRLDRA